MTSETWVLGGPVVEKVAIGARVGQFAATLGPGFVEAWVKNYGDRVVVGGAQAYPLTDRAFDVSSQLERHLNADSQ